MLRILVVDDSPDTRDALRLVLEAWGHEVRLTEDGPAALRAAEHFRPDVVILDLAMPGMDGYEVARRLRQADAERPVLICLSGYGTERDVSQARAAGFDYHLTKPADVDDLERLVKACEQPPGREPPGGAPHPPND